MSHHIPSIPITFPRITSHKQKTGKTNQNMDENENPYRVSNSSAFPVVADARSARNVPLPSHFCDNASASCNPPSMSSSIPSASSSASKPSPASFSSSSCSSCQVFPTREGDGFSLLRGPYTVTSKIDLSQSCNARMERHAGLCLSRLRVRKG